mgnify:CR=1 FL=1
MSLQQKRRCCYFNTGCDKCQKNRSDHNHKTGENNKKLSGAVFEIKAAKDIKTAGGTTLVAANTVVDTVTTDGNGSAASKQLELGQYIVKEKTAPDRICPGYYRTCSYPG